MNVPRSGWSYGPFSLLAHLPGAFPGNLYISNFERPGNLVVVYAWNPGSLAAVSTEYPKLPGHPHFPYGYVVDPD